MGGACHHCCSQPEEAAKATQIASHPVNAHHPHHDPHRERVKSEESHDHHDGYHGGQLQKRAQLQVKDGGFALGNFAATNTGRIEDYYDIEKQKLGEGGFGSVRKGRDQRTGRVYAIKTIRKKGVEEPEKLKEEIDIMKLLDRRASEVGGESDHPNIVRFQESFEDGGAEGLNRTTAFYNWSLSCAKEAERGGELIERVSADGSITERQAAGAGRALYVVAGVRFAHVAGCVRDMLRAINYLHMLRP
ncbi:unnamed protein product [Effrenium voratum]|nr:unnamed protein product [Effrenium voratum]